jgi:hypothetical protein
MFRKAIIFELLGYIGFLNDLWRWHIPVIFDRCENAILKILHETGFDSRKGFIVGKPFPQPIFASEPNVLHRVLLGGVGC